MSRKKANPVVADGEMMKRVLSVRKDLGLDQRSFGEKIRATQTQVSEWERGTEKPSAQKLVAIGNVAPKSEDRSWFWRQSGLDLARLRDDVLARPETDRYPLTEFNLLFSEQGETMLAPLVKRFYFGTAGQLEVESDRFISLPISFGMSRNGDLVGPHLVCVQVPHESELNSVIAAGDLAVIDRSADPDGLVDANFSMTAIVSEYAPPPVDPGSGALEFFARIKAARADAEDQKRIEGQEQIQGAQNPVRPAKSEEETDRTWRRVQERIELPSFRLGWLRLRPAGEMWTDDFTKQPSRFSLDLEPPRRGSLGKSIALSDWKAGNNPNRPQVRKNVEGTHPKLGRVVILGHVVAWLKYEVVSNRGPEDVALKYGSERSESALAGENE